MKKRFWALFLAVMMVVSVLPTAAFAIDGDALEQVPSVSTPDRSPVKITKSVNEAGNRLTMEAYVTGQVVTTNPEPLDIVLVLDVSGSMKDDISIVKEENVTYRQVSNTNAYVYFNWRYGDGEYWYSPDSGTTFYPITNIDWDANLGLDDYTYTYDAGNGETKTYSSRGALLSPSNIYYKTVKTQTITVSKMEALKNAVNSFIDTTAQKNAAITDGSAKHRISIVKFAGNSTNKISNEMYKDGQYTYNNSQIVMELTTVDDAGADALKDEVNKFTPAGATAADYGMAHAKTVLNNRPEGEETRKQVVIFFTDGEPNHGNGFDGKVANDTVETAKELKDGGATIYTIGVFAGADPTDSTKNANKFMHAVSSNYPEAEKYTDVGRTLNNNGYYQTATTQDDLTDIFGDIAKDMIPDVTAGSSSVLTDTVSKYFTPVIPEGATGVTVKVVNAVDNVEDTNFNLTGSFGTGDKAKTLTVSGFDYSAEDNVVTKDDDGNITGGKKLVISFDITPDTSCNDWQPGTKYYPTNVAGDNEEDNAGLYSESGEAFASLDRSPTVPVTAYSVTYSYSGETPSGAPAVPAAKAYLPDTEVFVAAAPTLPGYSFSGWTTKANVGISENKFTMPECAVALTGSWSKNPPATTYSVTYTWTGLPESETVYTGTGTGKAVVTLPKDNTEYADGDSYTIDSTYNSTTVAYTTDDGGNVKDRYIFSGWDKTNGTIKEADVIVRGTWYLDNWQDNANGPDQPTGGDGTPDKYQVLVKYESEGVNKGTVNPEYEVITLTDGEVLVDTADVTASGSTATPESGYSFAEWKYNDTSISQKEVLHPQTIKGAVGGTTYTYTAYWTENVPNLSVTKTVNKTSVTVGDTVKYTIKVTNTGNVDLTNVNVVEAFGGDFSKIFDLTGATKASTFNGFVIGELKAGETKEITFSYKTTKRETLTNSVVVSALNPDGGTVTGSAASPDVTVKSEPITPVGPSKPQLNYEDHYAYVVGYPDGLVHPERNITRAEVATIFFRMLLDESREYFWAQENDFSDVAETDWFNNAVSTLANAQLINGYPDGSYRPNANITRAEFATIAIRFFLDEDVEIEENNLSDVKGHWAEANINLAYALELINGYPDGTFRPDQKITRAEAMAIVNRVLKRAPEKDHLLKDMIEWPDNLNTAAWYYADVQEATNSHKFHMDKEEEYEIWTELLPVRDWVALEQEWSKANSSKNPGEVVDIKITTPEAGDNGLKLD